MRTQDTVLLSGWLFADLLLALVAIFLIANTANIQPEPPPPVPKLVISPLLLDANAGTPGCAGGTSNPVCRVMISESPDSKGDIIWSVNNDMSEKVQYSIQPQDRKLSPGQRPVYLTISLIPCQNGSFTFTAYRLDGKIKTQVVPVNVIWHCVPPQQKPERLDFNYQTFNLTIQNANTFLTGNSLDSDVKQQIMKQPILREKSVGLAVVYGGAPDVNTIPQAQQVASKVYSLLGSLTQTGFTTFQRSSYYKPLYTLGNNTSNVQVDVYFFTR